MNALTLSHTRQARLHAIEIEDRICLFALPPFQFYATTPTTTTTKPTFGVPKCAEC